MKVLSTRPAAGFTLFELVMVMGIVAILAAIGLPSFKYVTTSNRISTEINGLLSDMRFARSESVKQGLPVTVCATTNGTACSNSNDWSTGWIVFSDPGSTHAMLPAQIALKWQKAFSLDFGGTDTFVADNNLQYVIFNREGFGSSNIATATNTVTVALKSAPAVQQWTRCLLISPIGALSISRAPVLNCT
jgi:type IV fimbrial biogenesis protein FimT